MSPQERQRPEGPFSGEEPARAAFPQVPVQPFQPCLPLRRQPGGVAQVVVDLAHQRRGLMQSAEHAGPLVQQRPLDAGQQGVVGALRPAPAAHQAEQYVRPARPRRRGHDLQHQRGQLVPRQQAAHELGRQPPRRRVGVHPPRRPAEPGVVRRPAAAQRQEARLRRARAAQPQRREPVEEAVVQKPVGRPVQPQQRPPLDGQAFPFVAVLLGEVEAGVPLCFGGPPEAHVARPLQQRVQQGLAGHAPGPVPERQQARRRAAVAGRLAQDRQGHAHQRRLQPRPPLGRAELVPGGQPRLGVHGPRRVDVPRTL